MLNIKSSQNGRPCSDLNRSIKTPQLDVPSTRHSANKEWLRKTNLLVQPDCSSAYHAYDNERLTTAPFVDTDAKREKERHEYKILHIRNRNAVSVQQ